MRIGVLAPVWIPVPPEGYGGIELVVSLLTEELVARGHDVTLFASGGSRTKANLRTGFDEPPTDRLWETEPDASHVGAAYGAGSREYADEHAFDIAHGYTARKPTSSPGACGPTSTATRSCSRARCRTPGSAS